MRRVSISYARKTEWQKECREDKEKIPIFFYKGFLSNICLGSVKNFVALVKNGSFLVRIIDMTILIEKEFIYGSSKRPNSTDYYRKQHYCRLPS